MASSAKSTTTNFKAVGEQLRQFNGRLTEAGRRVGTLYLDSYEKSVEGVTGLQKKLGERVPVEGLQNLVAAQADLTRQLVRTQTAVARELLAAR